MKPHIPSALATLLLASVLSACSESPTGRRQLLLFSDEALAGMGVQSFTEIQSHAIPSRNGQLNRYIGCVTGHLTRRQGGEWELVVLNDDAQLNAFALPGNKIGVYTGLLRAAQNQDQLAAVVGHEIGHVLARHSNERLSSQWATETGLQLLYQLWTGGEKAEPPTEAALALLGLGASVGILLPFSRAHEAEADQIGLMLMAEAGFDPRQSVQLWQNMSAASERGPDISFLSTHPSHETRSHLLRQHMGPALRRYESARAAAPAPGCTPTSAPAPAPAAPGSGRWQW